MQQEDYPELDPVPAEQAQSELPDGGKPLEDAELPALADGGELEEPPDMGELFADADGGELGELPHAGEHSVVADGNGGVTSDKPEQTATQKKATAAKSKPEKPAKAQQQAPPKQHDFQSNDDVEIIEDDARDSVRALRDVKRAALEARIAHMKAMCLA